MGTKFSTLFRCLTSKPCLLLLAALSCAGVVGAQTAPTSLFQLDGTAGSGAGYPNCTYLVGGVVTPNLPCDNWDLLNGSGSSGANAGGSAGHSGARVFINGGAGSEVFTGGGSKDPIDTTSWACTIKSSPNKDTLTNGYAAAYVGPNTKDLVTVFGAERLSVNGDANIGIWFFQKSVLCNPATGKFSNSHTPGDVLVLSAFTGGGTVPTIAVYSWDPTCLAAGGTCADSNLRQLFSQAVLCDSNGTPSSQAACAITNANQIPVSWPYPTSASATPSNVPTQAFFEGGADISFLLNKKVCFSSFLEETRSSQTTSATLKDFLNGSFPVCHVSVSKTMSCDSFNADGTFNYSYTGTVKNDGVGDLFNVTVTDTPTGGSAVAYSCGNLGAGTSVAFPSANCPQPGSTTNTVTTSAHPDTNVANVTADTSPDGSSPPVSNTTGSVKSSDASATSCAPKPGLMTTKSCVTAFQLVSGAIEVRVDYTGDVKNTGQDNLSGVNVADDVDSKSYGPFSLIPGQSICYTNGQTECTAGAAVPAPGCPNPTTVSTGCPTLSVTDGLSSPPAGVASYFPSSAASALGLTAGRIQFTDTVNATGKDAFGNNVPLTGQPPANATASCVICPFGACAAQ